MTFFFLLCTSNSLSTYNDVLELDSYTYTAYGMAIIFQEGASLLSLFVVPKGVRADNVFIYNNKTPKRSDVPEFA